MRNLYGKVLAYLTVFVPFLGVLLAIYFWRYMHSQDIIVFAIMDLLTGLGITVGFHRFITHKSFKCQLWLSNLLVILGTMAAQGPVVYWVASHRRHHTFSDTNKDPHSPVGDTDTFFKKIRAFWHAHVGWMLNFQEENYKRYAPDLIRDPAIMKINNAYFFWVMVGIVVPGIVVGLWTQSIVGFFTGMLWGGLVRIFAVHHVTWAVNSVCHLYGKRDYASYPDQDNSRDNWILGILAYGEGWHNAHHAFPSSARHGLKWWQVDVSYYVIAIFNKMGMAWDVKLPREGEVEKAKK